MGWTWAFWALAFLGLGLGLSFGLGPHLYFMSSFNFEKTIWKNFKCEGECPFPSLIKASFIWFSSCDLWLVIKALEFSRYGIYSFMTWCKFLQNTIRLSRLLYWLKILSLLRSAIDGKIRGINSILSQCCQRRNNRLFQGNNLLFFCSNKTEFEILSISRERFKIDVIYHLTRRK